MIEIHDKLYSDPVGRLPLANAYMHWTLLATEATLGKRGAAQALRRAGLMRWIGHYPEDELRFNKSITLFDTSRLTGSLYGLLGPAGKSVQERIGQTMGDRIMHRQELLFGLTSVAGSLVPFPLQLRAGLELIRAHLQQWVRPNGQPSRVLIEDRRTRWALIEQDCPICAGKLASAPMCWIHTGLLKEVLGRITGKPVRVVEVACRAHLAPACVWEIDKRPLGEISGDAIKKKPF